MRAIDSGLVFRELFLNRESLDPEACQRLIQSTQPSAEVFDLSMPLLSRLRYGERTEPVVAIAQRPDLGLAQLKMNPDDGRHPLVMILDGIEKPGNIGAVIRSADGAGASAVILANPKCDVLHPNCIRASMGSVFTVPVATANSDEIIRWCGDRNICLIRLEDSAEMCYTQFDWTLPAAVVAGSEHGGISDAWAETPARVSIPMNGISDSLNISVAAAVVLYEAARQRTSLRSMR